jgi:ribosomal protein S6E (S10)
MGGNKNAHRLLGGKPERKKTSVDGDIILNQIIKINMECHQLG